LRRYSLCWYFGYPGENQGVHQGTYKRIEDKPKRAQDGLLVGYGNISLNKQYKEVAVIPDLIGLEVEEGFAGSYYGDFGSGIHLGLSFER
jgi:hypothetical protein